MQVWDFSRNHETHLNCNFCSSWILQYIDLQDRHRACFSVTYRGGKCCFLFCFVFLQSAVRYITWKIWALSTGFFPLKLQSDLKHQTTTIHLKKKEKRKKKFEMLHLHKKHFFQQFSTITKKIHAEMGKLVCFDRNWQESKQSNFELSKVQFHWIAKYLCKIEIVENSIFVFQVLPPQDSKLLG